MSRNRVFALAAFASAAIAILVGRHSSRSESPGDSKGDLAERETQEPESVPPHTDPSRSIPPRRYDPSNRFEPERLNPNFDRARLREISRSASTAVAVVEELGMDAVPTIVELVDPTATAQEKEACIRAFPPDGSPCSFGFSSIVANNGDGTGTVVYTHSQPNVEDPTETCEQFVACIASVDFERTVPFSSDREFIARRGQSNLTERMPANELRDAIQQMEVALAEFGALDLENSVNQFRKRNVEDLHAFYKWLLERAEERQP